MMLTFDQLTIGTDVYQWRDAGIVRFTVSAKTATAVTLKAITNPGDDMTLSKDDVASLIAQQHHLYTSSEDAVTDRLANQYADFMTTNTTFTMVDDTTISVSTPFVDALGEGISFTISEHGNGRYLVSDDGFTLWTLELDGIAIVNSSDRHNRINALMQRDGFAVASDDAIYKVVSEQDLVQAINDITQLLITITNVSSL